MNDQLAKKFFDALRAAEKIRRITDGMSLADYQSDEVTRLAVERLLEMVGEALGAALRMNPELESGFPDFRRAVDLRNRIIHGYNDINDAAIWDIVQTNLPPPMSQMEALLRQVVDDMKPS